MYGQVNAIDDWGRTACHFAAQNNDRDIVDALVSAGANIEILDSDYFSAADYTSDPDVENILRLPHSCNPPNAPQRPLRLIPSKIRTRSPAKREHLSTAVLQDKNHNHATLSKDAIRPSPNLPSATVSDEREGGETDDPTTSVWWVEDQAFSNYSDAAEYCMHEYLESVKMAAQEAFDKAEASIIDASRAASSPKVRASLADVEYQAAFDKVFRTFQKAEAAVNEAARAAATRPSPRQTRVARGRVTAEPERFAADTERDPESSEGGDTFFQLGEKMIQGTFTALNDIPDRDEAGISDLLTTASPSELDSNRGKSSISSQDQVGLSELPLYNPDCIPQHSHKTWEQMESDNAVRLGWKEEDGIGWYDGDKYSGRYKAESVQDDDYTHSEYPDWYIADLNAEIKHSESNSAPKLNRAAMSASKTADAKDAATRRALSAEKEIGTQEGCDIGL